MLDDYKLKGKRTKIEVELEAEVAERLNKMVGHVKLSSSEIVNTALKRFINGHQDFLPKADQTKPNLSR